MSDKKCKIPTESQRMLAKKALLVSMEGKRLSRALRDEDIQVTKMEIMVPSAILDQSISSFASEADLFADGPQGDWSDVDKDWPTT